MAILLQQAPKPYKWPLWVDHPYRLRLPSGRWSYVAEPYQLDGEALDDIRKLHEAGYEVMISAGAARHCPGGTLAVEFQEWLPGMQWESPVTEAVTTR